MLTMQDQRAQLGLFFSQVFAGTNIHCIHCGFKKRAKQCQNKDQAMVNVLIF